MSIHSCEASIKHTCTEFLLLQGAVETTMRNDGADGLHSWDLDCSLRVGVRADSVTI